MNRKIARENAFLLLFESASKVDETAEEIFDKATERGLEADNYVKTVFFGVNSNKKAIGECVENCLVGWKKSRISFVTTALLNLGVYELMFCDDIPVKVTINEAIELSKKYDDEKAYALVNGALNKASEILGRK